MVSTISCVVTTRGPLPSDRPLPHRPGALQDGQSSGNWPSVPADRFSALRAAESHVTHWWSAQASIVVPSEKCSRYAHSGTASNTAVIVHGRPDSSNTWSPTRSSPFFFQPSGVGMSVFTARIFPQARPVRRSHEVHSPPGVTWLPRAWWCSQPSWGGPSQSWRSQAQRRAEAASASISAATSVCSSASDMPAGSGSAASRSAVMSGRRPTCRCAHRVRGAATPCGRDGLRPSGRTRPQFRREVQIGLREARHTHLLQELEHLVIQPRVQAHRDVLQLLYSALRVGRVVLACDRCGRAAARSASGGATGP